MSAPYYEDDLVQLWHGDCREVTAWLEADVLVMDPPYGIAWRSGVTSYRSKGRVNGVTDAIAGDLGTATRDAALALWGDRPAVVFGSWRAERPQGVTHRLIWHKKGQMPGPVNAAFLTQDEEIYIIGAGAWRKSSPPLRSVIATSEERGRAVSTTGHPTPKPLGLMEVLLDRCPPGTVADPFAGSGSTLVAAKQIGRRSVGVELDERYCEIAANRLAQDTLFGGAA